MLRSSKDRSVHLSTCQPTVKSSQAILVSNNPSAFFSLESVWQVDSTGRYSPPSVPLYGDERCWRQQYCSALWARQQGTVLCPWLRIVLYSNIGCLSCPFYCWTSSSRSCKSNTASFPSDLWFMLESLVSNKMCASEALCMVGEFIKPLFPVDTLIADNIAECSCCLFFRDRERILPFSSNSCQWL